MSFLKILFNRKQFITELEEKIRVKAINDYSQQRDDRKQEIEIAELSMYIGKKVICISNECENPVIGVGKSIALISMANNPVLVVYDYLTEKECLIMGKIFFFNDQIFNSVFKLEPNELVELLYGCTDTPREIIRPNTRENIHRVTAQLRKSGFFEPELLDY